MSKLILARRKFLFLAPALIASTQLMPLSTNSDYFNEVVEVGAYWKDWSSNGVSFVITRNGRKIEQTMENHISGKIPKYPTRPWSNGPLEKIYNPDVVLEHRMKIYT